MQNLIKLSTGQVPAKFRMDHVEIPPGGRDKIIDYGTIRARKFNRSTYVIDGYYDLLRLISDDLSVNVDIFAWQANEYRKLGDRTLKEVCSLARTNAKTAGDQLSKTNLDANFTCPLLPMRIIVNNITMPDLPVSYMPGDRFRINTTIFSAEEEIFAKYAAYLVKEI